MVFIWCYVCLFDYQLKGVELSRMADQEMFVGIKDVFVVRRWLIQVEELVSLRVVAKPDVK